MTPQPVFRSLAHRIMYRSYPLAKPVHFQEKKKKDVKNKMLFYEVLVSVGVKAERGAA